MITKKEFLQKLPSVVLIVVVGDCGKRTTYNYISSILSNYNPQKSFNFMAVDISNDNLANDLKKIKQGSLVLIYIEEEDIPIFEDSGVNPSIVVFSCISKGNFKKYHPVIKNHTYTNYIIGTDETIDLMKNEYTAPIKSKILRTGVSILPRGKKMADEPYHLRENASLSVRVAEIFDIPNNVVVQGLSKFNNLPGRIEMIKDENGVKYVNDAYSKCFDSLKVALSGLSGQKNTVLIFGGNGTLGAVSSKDISVISQYCHTFITLPGTGSQMLYKELLKRGDVSIIYSEDVFDAVKKATQNSRTGDLVIFSPGFYPNNICGPRIEDRSKLFINALNSL